MSRRLLHKTFLFNFVTAKAQTKRAPTSGPFSAPIAVLFSAPGRAIRKIGQDTPWTQRSVENVESGLTFTTLVLSLSFCISGALAWKYYSTTQTVPHHSTPHTLGCEKGPRTRLYPGMAHDIPPGRPGNLTSEQEAKLKELWEALFRLTEVWPVSSGGDVNGKPISSSVSKGPAPDSPDKGSNKRKRFGSLLGKKSKHDEPASETASISESIASALPADDKHGLGKEFRIALANQTPEQLRENLWEFAKCDDPDALLLRYLRARKWDVQAALVMLIATIQWRANVIQLDSDIMRQGEIGAIAAGKGQPVSGIDQKMGQDFMLQLKMGKSFLHGVDKEGRPICYVRVRLHRAGDQSEAALERYTVWTIETARLLLRPPVDTAVIIFDMTSFGMANMDYSPVKFMIKVFEANYPESLGAVLVHKSPWLFHSIWSIIKGWLDPVVASKVHFTKDVRDLAEFIPRENIPKELGGEESWSYDYTPPSGESHGDSRLGDENNLAPLLEKRRRLFIEYQNETLKWCLEDKPQEETITKRLDLTERIRQSYWEIDPYIRARSMYDRTGIIKEAGIIDFYPDRKKKGELELRGEPLSQQLSRSTENGHRVALKGLEAPSRQSTDSTGDKSIYYDALE